MTFIGSPPWFPPESSGWPGHLKELENTSHRADVRRQARKHTGLHTPPCDHHHSHALRASMVGGLAYFRSNLRTILTMSAEVRDSHVPLMGTLLEAQFGAHIWKTLWSSFLSQQLTELGKAGSRLGRWGQARTVPEGPAPCSRHSLLMALGQA